MSKSYVDTTVLVDALLKEGNRRDIANKAISHFDESELPEYAIKELKAGPLQHYVYLHNKLSKTGSLGKTLEALSRLYMQSRKQSTALEGLYAAWMDVAAKDLSHIEKEIDNDDLDSYAAKRARLATKRRIFKAWRKKDKIVSSVVHYLLCFEQSGPVELDGAVKLKDRKCNPKPECCMADDFRDNKESTCSLMEEIEKMPQNRENGNRYSVLKELYKDENKMVDNKKCRYLGDAVFAFYCPDEATILTTNIKDHEPLAEALGKAAVSPSEVCGTGS